MEEGLRWEPPITAIMRVARRDVRLGGVEIPEGARVITSLGSASRDESVPGPCRSHASSWMPYFAPGAAPAVGTM